MFQGLYTALITPFLEDGSVDFESITNLIIRQFNSKVNGIILFGTTGEGMTMTEQERGLVIQKVISLVNELTKSNKALLDGKQYRPQIIVGTGTNCTSTTIEQSVNAEKLGADGVMVVTPYYNRPSQDGLYAHYKAINDAINIPIILYNIPTRTGVHIEDTTLMRLMSLSNVMSLKDYDSLRPIRLYIDWSDMHNISNSKDFIADAQSNYELFIAACSSRFTILAGDDVNSLSIYVNGGHGAVSVASNIIPEICYELHSAARRFDMKHAQAIHAHLHPIYNALFCEVNPVPVKYFAQRLGLIKRSFVRQPLHPLSNSSKTKIDRIIDRYFR
jgi:4-hydroxy-tetrahydrodipicolinate synthase